MRKTINHFYPALAPASYHSKRTTILRWVRNRKSLEAAVAVGKGQHMKVRDKGVATILSKESEMELVHWVDELRGDGIPVSSQMSTGKALLVAQDAGLRNFRASDKWVGGFKGRHKFYFRCPSRQNQLSPANLDEIAADFAIQVEATVRDLGITRVYNADQTAVFLSI
ncbi:hypothetical protein V7S43_017549 [Phytophthora oleae]|uniref:HTH CENPB-type domain-containing protein n=1 Tax=Phytophthora oleae TaxID=2107226 RepID=A0ABD3ETD8_9STRA